VVVTLIPPKEIFLLHDDITPYERRRTAFASAFRPYGFVVIDMLESVSADETLPLYFKTDTHFNQRGHEWFAQLLRSRPPLSDSESERKDLARIPRGSLP
jgi:hypothetical protein